MKESRLRVEEMLAKRVRNEILTELDSLKRLVEELGSAPTGDESWALRARGSILHDFYTGVERIFVRIADELNGGVPAGQQWHRQLVTDMAMPIDDLRPAVISVATADRLAEYLRFRHVFRNIYGSTLEPERLSPLVDRLPDTLDAVADDVTRFISWLAGDYDDD